MTEGARNLVVTGATSFLGTALIEEALRRGYQVYAVLRPHSANKRALDRLRCSLGEECALTLHMTEMNLEDLDCLKDCIKVPCRIFFHFGWDGSGSAGRMNDRVQQKNVEYGLKALRAAKDLGCERFVFSGSQAEYGVHSCALREDLACDPVSEYGKAKVEFGRRAGELCRAWRETGESGMEYIHARIFSVYGFGDHPWSLVNTCLDTFLRGGVMNLGACTHQWNYLYIEDLVRGLLALALSKGSFGDDGIYNLAGGGESTMELKRYVETIHDLCGRRGTCVYGVVRPNAEGPANLIPDIGKIMERTGWKPAISFEEGIRRMIEKKRAEGGRKACILCGHGLEGAGLIELSGMPASAQDIPDENQVKADKGITLKLCQCPECGLVQFDCEPVAYYRDVIRSGGYSTTMAELRRRQYSHLIEAYGLEGKKFLEVGCGAGEFLKMLSPFPVKAYGVEHSPVLAEAAKRSGLCVTEGFAETEHTILGENGPYDVFLSFNFLEHQPCPGVMLECIKNNLTDRGWGLITVPSLEYILQYDGYYELLRDHIAYYTFDTLRRLLEDHGFAVVEEEMINRDTLSVIVRKRADGDKKPEEGDKARGGKVDLSGLKTSLTDIGEQMESLCGQLKKEGKTLAVWGASHQGFTLAATTVLKDYALYIIDSAPFKQGKYAPASHLPIIPPEDYCKNPADVILIVAPGYTEEIAGTIRSRFGDEVKILALRSDRVEELT